MQRNCRQKFPILVQKGLNRRLHQCKFGATDPASVGRRLPEGNKDIEKRE